MRLPRNYQTKIMGIPRVFAERERLRAEGKTVVFTNGCFDLLHPGHVDYLYFARNQGDALLVGLNSDASVRRNKGPSRPFNSERHRALVVAALEMVDGVVMFDTKEPEPLIAQLLPDVLVKGEDWAHYVSGREAVEAHGGRVVLAPLLEGFSTTGIAEHICRMETEREQDRTCM